MTAFFLHYLKPYEAAESLNLLGFRLGADGGDTEFAGYHAHARSARLAVDGTSLPAARGEMERYRRFTTASQHKIATSIIDAILDINRSLISG